MSDPDPPVRIRFVGDIDPITLSNMTKLAKRLMEYTDVYEAKCEIARLMVGGDRGMVWREKNQSGPGRVMHCLVASTSAGDIRNADKSLADLPFDFWPDPKEWRLRSV